MIKNFAPAHSKYSLRHALIALMLLFALAACPPPPVPALIATAAGHDASTSAPMVEPVPPNAPLGLTATRFSSTRLDLSWTDNSADEDGFRVERSPDGSTGWTLVQTTAPNATAFSDASPTRATTY